VMVVVETSSASVVVVLPEQKPTYQLLVLEVEN